MPEGKSLVVLSKSENEKILTKGPPNAQYRVINRQPVLKNKGLTSDQTIRFTSIQAAKKCPNQLRRVGYRDITTGKHYIFLTNNFKLAASNHC